MRTEKQLGSINVNFEVYDYADLYSNIRT